jgi:hypothetical protein
MFTRVRVLILIALLWLVGVACLAGAALVGAVPALPGLCALAICTRHARRGQFGAVEAWAAWSLAPLGFLSIISLASIHLHEFTGRGAGCDAMAQDCSPQVLQGLAHTASLAAFVAAAILTVVLIVHSRRTQAGLETRR